MTREEIKNRINKLMFNELYTFDDIKDDLDDAIIQINSKLHSKFPMMSTILTDKDSEYKYTPEASDEVPNPQPTEIFPEIYIRSVVINYAVASLFAQQDEFSNAYINAQNKFENGLDNMFRDYYENIPEVFVDDDGGYMELDVYSGI